MTGRSAWAVPAVSRIDGRLLAPPSKSVMQRALVAASLAPGLSRLRRPLFSDDTSHLMTALRAAGIPIATGGPGTDPVVEVRGMPGSGDPGPSAAGATTVQVGNAGTAMRFLAARLAAGSGRFILDGDERMRQRPIEDLLAALRSLGAEAASVHGDGRPPIRVGGRGLPGGQVRIAGGRSSQFVSALLLAAPAAPQGIEIAIEGELVSRPYIDLTLGVMSRFGVEGFPAPPSGEARHFGVAAGARYRPADLTIDGDYSSASYFFAAAAIVPGRVVVDGLDPGSLQGDRRFLEILEEMGCRVERGRGQVLVEGGGVLRGLSADLREMPDMAPTLACVALFAEGDTRIAGVPHLRDKESDRIAVLCEAIRALGGEAVPAADGLTIRPRPLRGAAVFPHDDHRIAMAFAVVGLRLPGVIVKDPGCVTKSFPGFRQEIERLAVGG